MGVHPVPEAPDPCFLVEMEIPAGLELDPAGITQEAEEGVDWQRPLDAQRHHEGQGGAGETWSGPLSGPARLVFFFHFLRLDRPLLTPAGPLALPPPSPRPARLGFLEYVVP